MTKNTTKKTKWAIAIFLAVGISFQVNSELIFRVDAQVNSQVNTEDRLKAELEAQVKALLSIVASLQAQRDFLQGAGGPPVGVVPQVFLQGFLFKRTLQLGMSGNDVLVLQKILNGDERTQVAHIGLGSPGRESMYFDLLTRTAVMRFQELYRSEILSPLGLVYGTGIVGPMTRAKLNSLILAGVFPSGALPSITPSFPQIGLTPILNVASTSQPSASLAPENAARVPFARFVIETGENASVTISSFTVERMGPAQNAVFNGVVLLDESGSEIGIARTLNSNNRATVGETIKITPRTSKTFTIAGNMASNLDAYDGQRVSLSLVGITSPGALIFTGELPINGPSHTINSTLSIGSVKMERGITDPRMSRTIRAGTAGYTLSAIRITSSPAERGIIL